MKEMAQGDILITLATQLAITDIRRYVLLKVGAWLLSVHISTFGRRQIISIEYHIRAKHAKGAAGSKHLNSFSLKGKFIAPSNILKKIWS